MEIVRNSEKLDRVRDAAKDLGFDGFGIAPAKPGQWSEQYRQWIDNSFEGEMAYMSRHPEKRADPSLVLPGAKNVICLSMNYFTADKDMSFLDDKATGDISLYALNDDYHDVILPRLKKLENLIQNEYPGCQTKVYVDTGPVLEKPLAQQAGLGWVGKHTNLITEGMGSWFFLAEILVDVALPESQPAKDHCGTCRSCIDICPTQAIVAPYVLDSRRCISYLTIELKGPIPTEFRKAIGNHIYGCDDCQIVCPWNSYAVKVEQPAFEERAGSRLLLDLIKLDDEAFRQRFRKSPIKRIKRRGFLRNVAIALGNSGDPAAVQALIHVLDDPEPLIRAHIVWALGELLKAEALEVIREKLPHESDPMVTDEIAALTLRVKKNLEENRE